MKNALLIVLVLLAGVGLGYGLASAQEETGKAMQAPPGFGPQEEHKFLEKFVGEWENTMNFRMAPGAPTMESKGKETVEAILNDTWILYREKYDFMGSPYEALGLLGYDPLTKKYIGVRVDNMKNFMETMEGTYDEASKTFHMVSKSRNPMTGKPFDLQLKNKIESDDRHTMVGVFPHPTDEEKEWEGFRIDCKRAKKSSE